MKPIEILQNVNDWLKFAEAKNAALIAFCGVTIPYLFSCIPNSQNLISIYLFMSISLTSMALLVSTLSFIPMLDPAWSLIFKNGLNSNREPVTIFYGDIAGIPKQKYVNGMLKEFSAESAKSNNLNEQIFQQIHTNSMITTRKYVLFRYSVYLLLSGIFTPLAMIIILIMRKNGEIS